MDYDKWLALGKEMSMSGEALMEFNCRKEREGVGAKGKKSLREKNKNWR